MVNGCSDLLKYVQTPMETQDVLQKQRAEPNRDW